MGIQKEKAQVRDMFDRIAPRYDYLNHLLSFGIDRRWRKKAIRFLEPSGPEEVLDVATGTGDLALAMARIMGCRVTGLDISEKMLEVFARKAEGSGVSDHMRLVHGDSENIPFPDASFDAVTCAFGLRNFEHLDTGLQEMYRVLKPGGKTVILEFSLPVGFPMKQLYGLYFRRILPRVGKRISKHEAAYTYLPETVRAFPEREGLKERLDSAGFIKSSYRTLTAGVVCLYEAEKRNNKPPVL